MLFFTTLNDFNRVYTCYSMNFYKNCTETMLNGGKILLPSSALEILTRLNIQYPMLFKLTNESTNRSTHCGVLEFVADEGRIYAPYWMMINLNINEGSDIRVENVALEIATFAKFQPQKDDFLQISNPKAVLENALRDFACLTKGDHLAINYNNKIYELEVLETKPKNAVSIIECDMRVEFAESLISNEKPTASSSSQPASDIPSDDDDYKITGSHDDGKFKLFSGSGIRLDGKTKESVHSNATSMDSSSHIEEVKRGVPNYNYRPGLLTFARSKPTTNQGDVKDPEPVLFPGPGKQLKERKAN